LGNERKLDPVILRERRRETVKLKDHQLKRKERVRKVLTKPVPAVAVIQVVRVFSKMDGRKGSVESSKGNDRNLKREEKRKRTN